MSRAARHWLEYVFFTTVRWKVRFLPERLSLGFGQALGWFLGVVLGVRREVTEENLARAFPDESEAWRRRVADDSYAHLGREAMATLVMSWMTREEIVARTPIAGWEAFEAALAQGRGVVLATGHLGNWEVGAACLAARGVPVDGITKSMSNTRFGEELSEVRRRLGYREVDVSQAPRMIPRALSEGRMVALLGDQNIRSGGVFVPFFGTPAATAKGVALFALKTGAPIFLGVAVRTPGWPQRYQGILEPIDVERTGDLDEDVRRITARYTEALEGLVRAYPEQYFWQHKRWATRPQGDGTPELPPGAAV